MTVLHRTVISLLFVASAVALFIGTGLFNQREILKHRTLRLEHGIVQLAQHIEAEDSVAAHPLEEQDLAPVVVSTDALHTYFKIDAVTGKAWRHPVSRLRDTRSEGTLDHEIARILAKAEDGSGRLAATRDKLSATRHHAERTQATLSLTEQTLENTERTLMTRNNENTALTQTVAQHISTISSQQGEIEELGSLVREQDLVVQEQKESAIERELLVAALRQEIKLLGGDPTGSPAVSTSTASLRGSVQAVNAEWSYIVFEVADRDMMSAVKLEDLYHVKRGTAPVAKVEVTRILPDRGLVVAHIRNIWRGQHIRSGDDVMF